MMKKMNNPSVRSQQGFGMWGNLVFVALLVIVGSVGMKLFPVYMNQFKVDKVLHTVVKEVTFTGDAASDEAELYKTLERRWDIEDITDLKYRDVKMQARDSKRFLHYEYEVRVPMFYNISAVAHFTDNLQLSTRNN